MEPSAFSQPDPTGKFQNLSRLTEPVDRFFEEVFGSRFNAANEKFSNGVMVRGVKICDSERGLSKKNVKRTQF